MDTTVVAQSAIGALAALIGGLGGASIATRYQRSNERSRQHERAAEVLGSVWPLLTDLNPDSMLLGIPPAEPGQDDPMVELFSALDERVRVAREQLATLMGWWSTPKGSDLAMGLQWAIYEAHRWDVMAIKDLRSHRDVGHAHGNALIAWRGALSLADELRREIRGEAAPAHHMLQLPAHPKSWTGPAPTGLLQRRLSG
jgi:hypothetical protein